MFEAKSYQSRINDGLWNIRKAFSVCNENVYTFYHSSLHVHIHIHTFTHTIRPFIYGCLKHRLNRHLSQPHYLGKFKRAYCMFESLQVQPFEVNRELNPKEKSVFYVVVVVDASNRSGIVKPRAEQNRMHCTAG